MIYKIILLSLETIAIVCAIILAILNFANSEKYIKYLILFGIVSVVIIWLNPLLQQLIDKQLIKTQKPELNIEFSERDNQQLYIGIFSKNAKGTQIDDLHFKFDVPGEFISCIEKHKEKMGNSSVSHSMLAAVGNPAVVIATTIHVHCSAIMPNGSLSLIVDYKTTGDLPISERELIKDPKYPTHYTPLMDLHDYSPITYSWTFNGNSIIEKNSVNLENLDYIKKDNYQMVKQLKWHKDLESVKKMELKRKNW